MSKAESNIPAGDPPSRLQWAFDLINRNFTCDPRLPDLLGHKGQKSLTIGQLLNAFDPEQATEIKENVKRALQTRQDVISTVIINTIAQRYLAEVSIRSIADRKGAVEGYIQLQQNLPTATQEQELIKLLFNNSNNGIMLASAEHVILMVNNEYCIESGYTKQELIGQKASILKSGRYSPEFYKKLWSYVDSHKRWRGELLAINKKKEIYAHQVQLNRIDLADNSYFYSIESKRLDASPSFINEQSISEAYSLVIPDKKEFTLKLEQQYKKITREQTLVVIAFDVKFLKKVSPQTIKWLLSQRFNKNEINGHLGIIGDNIFCACWPIERTVEAVDQLLRNTLRTLQGEHHAEELDLTPIITIGASVLGIDAKTPRQLLAHSTQTLIANLHSNESAVHYYDPRLSKRFNRRNTLAKLLKESLNSNAINVHYQPIIELPALTISKFEALLRINLKTELAYDTQELIDIAEEFNWIDQIDNLVCKKALAALPLIQSHYENKQIEILINRSLANDKLTRCSLEDTLEVLCDSGADLSKVTIELTNSAFFKDLEVQQDWVKKLKEKSVKISIDGFGTRYSALAYLQVLPVDFIRIDRSFVSGLTRDSKEYAMIEMLCKLTHEIGGLVIAEGVEKERELALLSEANVDLLQGYIFSEPLSLEAILAKKQSFVPKELSKLSFHPPVITVKQLMSSDIIDIDADDRLGLAREKMQDNKFILVLKNNRCLGVLFHADLYAALSPYLNTEGEQNRDLITLEKRVHQIMNKNVPQLHMEQPIQDALPIFLADPSAVAIVTDNDKNSIGILTILELITAGIDFTTKP